MNTESDMNECAHLNIFTDENGFCVCPDCGIETEQISHDPEWKCYSANNASVARCQIKPKIDSLKKIFEDRNINISPAISAEIEAKYQKIVGDKVMRGAGRIGVVAVCYMEVMYDHGYYRPSNYIMDLFKINKKNFTTSLDLLCTAFPESRSKQITAEDLVDWELNTCLKIEENEQYNSDIKTIISVIKSRSSKLKRATPQALCLATIYFYLNHKHIHEDLHKIKVFSKLVNLSDITIMKLVGEIKTIFTD